MAEAQAQRVEQFVFDGGGLLEDHAREAQPGCLQMGLGQTAPSPPQEQIEHILGQRNVVGISKAAPAREADRACQLRVLDDTGLDEVSVGHPQLLEGRQQLGIMGQTIANGRIEPERGDVAGVTDRLGLSGPGRAKSQNKEHFTHTRASKGKSQRGVTWEPTSGETLMRAAAPKPEEGERWSRFVGGWTAPPSAGPGGLSRVVSSDAALSGVARTCRSEHRGVADSCPR